MRTAEVNTGFWWRSLRERDNLEYSCIDRRIILRWIFRKWDVGVWTGSIWLKMREVLNFLLLPGVEPR
jgi:hypothetical protein